MRPSKDKVILALNVDLSLEVSIQQRYMVSEQASKIQ
jgi:hypothetical protein